MLQIDLTGFKEHLKSRKVSLNTLLSYLADLRMLQDFLDEHSELGSWTEAIEKWLAVQSEYSKSTIKRRVASIRAYAKWKEIGEVLLLQQKWGRAEQLPRVLSSSQVRKIEKAAWEYAQQTGDFVFPIVVELMSKLGLRVSEVVSLKPSNFNLKEMVLRLKGKGDKEAVIPIPRGMKSKVKLLLQLTRNKDERIVPYNRITVWRKLKLVGRRVGIDLHPHMLRHTAATELLKRGVNLRVVQRVLRHASISTTQKYTHLTVDDIRNELEKVGWGEE